MTAQTCPTPAKARYATEGAALLAAMRLSAAKTLRTYHCTCDWWHLTSQPAPEKPREDTTVTQHVTALGDTDFTALVSAEVRGQATPEQAAALRNPMNLKRWADTLHAITVDIVNQLAARKGDTSQTTRDWRARVLTVQRGVQQRRAEAKELQQQAHHAYGAERERLRSLGITGPEARAAAGERAKERLIQAHQTEFGMYLIEEFEAAGLQIPLRLRRHAAINAVTATPDGSNASP